MPCHISSQETSLQTSKLQNDFIKRIDKLWISMEKIREQLKPVAAEHLQLRGGGHCRLLIPFFPCSAHRANVKKGARCRGALSVPPPMSTTKYASYGHSCIEAICSMVDPCAFYL